MNNTHNVNQEMSNLQRRLRRLTQHFNPNKYWKYRNAVLSYNGTHKLLTCFKLYYIKRSEAFNNATSGIHLGYGATFASLPTLPHGLYGIVISHNAQIGKNCTIFHQVTIGEDKRGAPIIGDNVILWAGCKVIGRVNIGNNVSIAPGITVMTDIDDDSVVLPPEFLVRKRNTKA